MDNKPTIDDLLRDAKAFAVRVQRDREVLDIYWLPPPLISHGYRPASILIVHDMPLNLRQLEDDQVLAVTKEYQAKLAKKYGHVPNTVLYEIPSDIRQFKDKAKRFYSLFEQALQRGKIYDTVHHEFLDVHQEGKNATLLFPTAQSSAAR